jgi:predicted metal-dependent hydrolase
MEQMTISNITIDVVRKDIKNIHLAVYPPNGRVRLAAPLLVNDDTIRLFAIAKLGWIKRQQRNFEHQERIPEREYTYRESHYFQGRRYLLNIVEHDAPPKVLVRNKTTIDLYIRSATTTSSAKRQEIMNEWYREQLKQHIPALIAKWEVIMDVNVHEWQIKQMKTKWGTCNIEKKRMWLNLELAKKPLHCLEYIIVHEMVHLLERHHNKRFLHYMDTFLPHWKQIKEELNALPLSHADWKEDLSATGWDT